MAVTLWARHGSTGREPLAESDPEAVEIIRKEKFRQTHGLELIASEVKRN